MNKLNLITLLFLLNIIQYSSAQVNTYSSSAQDLPVPNWQIAECGASSKPFYDYLASGKYALVYYADTWCGPCKGKAAASFNSTVIKNLLAKYPNKFQVFAAFDGPTDCNGVIKAKSEYGWGSEVIAFVDNTNEQSKFWSWGAPGMSIIDPNTKKLIYSTYNNDAPTGGLNALEQILNNKYTILDGSVNLAYRKRMINLIPESENIYQPFSCLNDGLKGTAFVGKGGKGAGFIIDFGGEATVTGFKSYFQESNGPKSYTVSVSDSENGPWQSIPGNFGSEGVNEIKGISVKAKFIKWQSSGSSWFSEFEVNGKMTITNVDNESIANELFDIYPNVAQSGFYFNATEKLIGKEYRIINQFGQSIKTGLISKELNTVNDLVEGVYLVHVTDKHSNVLTRKLVISR